ncbi:MAG: NADH-quinone oxidoreductase subunit M [Planctomycetes bacterium]|nr:NADH-quinone oxidoreductase subunit M [Planctomycetota bacterium]
MSTYAVIRVLVLLLVLVPLVAAAVLPAFGRFARRVALTLALVHLGLTAAVVTLATAWSDEHAKQVTKPGHASVHRFRPEFVPGDPGGRSHAESADGRTTWTLFRLSAAEPKPRVPATAVQLFLGVDGLNMWLVALAAVMLPSVILISWESIKEKPGAFYGWLFLLQAGLIGCFLSFDVILFYVFFELTLIPSFFLVGRWGAGSGRRDAARKFFLYTLAGSLLTLLGVIGVAVANPTPLHPKTGTVTNSAVVPSDGPLPASGRPQSDWALAARGPVTFSLPDLMGNVQVWADVEITARDVLALSERDLQFTRAAAKSTPADVRAAEQRLESAKQVLAEAQQVRARNVTAQFWLFVALMAGFMVKVPIWPFHTWLPAAYGAAPTGVTVMLSALMAKLGTFGVLRLVLPLVPDAAIQYGLPVIGALAAFGIVYAALCAYACTDIKLVIAYSSVSHLGFLVLGLFAFNKEGLTGSVLHMVNHGLSTGALFAALGFLADRYKTTEAGKFGGLMGRFPNYSVIVFVLCLASVGLPGLNNFVSEMMMMAGVFDARNPGANRGALAAVAAFGVFLSAWYTFTVLRRAFFGPAKEPPALAPEPRDISRREFFAFGSLAALCLVLGLLPQPVVDTMKADVRVLSIIGDKARARTQDVPYVYVEDEPKPPAPAADPAPPMGGKGPLDGKGPGGNKKGGGKGKKKDPAPGAEE